MSGMWLGSIVSVDCGNVLGVFQGEISNVDGCNQTISLINVSRNSVKCQVPEVTLSTLDIKNLKLIESTANRDFKHNNTNNFENTPAKESSSLSSNGHNANFQASEDNQKKKGENKKKGRSKGVDVKKFMKEKDEACFNVAVDSEVLDIDFDFEKNLALFDKRAVFDEINALSKSDHIRLVDCNKRGETKYRHDENVLASDLPILKQISLPGACTQEYVTDTGLVVPSVSIDFKKKLYKKGEEAGHKEIVRMEMIGRAACEMVLHLVGGSHRLNPQNNHQRPTVVILSGSHIQGAQAVNCGRHLANHCAIVTILSPPQKADTHSLLSSELKLFNMSCGKTVHSVSDLPPTVDIIVDALQSYENPQQTTFTASARQWAKQTKAPVLSLDPSPEMDSSFKPNFILSPGLPFPFRSDGCSIHICDVGLPSGVFKNAGCSYSSPFGSKFVIPLYPRIENS
ncbi:hypothetical protein JTE90_005640 [Oedothorax gibbosus]|uniref:Enhancer of mRNA-decapping protein 3 n=1 Tax=Oedothorax gibbosus TaxID=931172 RepID=A0AAV6UIR2_9ARAC|nr:hypothetical protein JTE90_005640 [Oedothorax gibbosus]